VALFAQGKTRIRERATPGERRVLDALAAGLEDDYTVWHNIPIMGSGREPDFVILHPGRGLLILEVKDWRRRTIAQANPMLVELDTERGRVTVDHPLSQARAYAQDIVHLLQKQAALRQQQGRHQGKLRMPWGWGAVLSHIKRADVASDSSFADVFPPDKVLLADDLLEGVDAMAFQERLWGMFQVHWEGQLTLPELNLVRGLLFPELRIGMQRALPLEPSPSTLVVRDVLQVMDLQQEAVARGLGEGHRLIHGPAGSGKTMILVFRAVQLQAVARPEKPVLVLCFNKALADRIDAMLRLKGVGPEVQVRTFHGWALELVKTYQLAPVKRNLRGDDFDALATIACEGIAARRVPQGQYAALLIDEAHDLADDWLTAAVKMVDPATKSLLVLYDDAQSIYQKSRRRSFAQLGIEARGRTEILKINYRNTKEVLSVALECARGVLEGKPGGDDEVPLILPDSAGRSGPWPVLRRFDSGQREQRFVVDAIQDLLAQGRAPADIAVLARHWRVLENLQAALAARGTPARLTRDKAAPSGNQLALTTLHSSKGLEYPVVLLVGLDLLDARADVLGDEMRLLYVGMTRATEVLQLTAAARTPIVDRVAEALGRLRPDPQAP